VSATLSPDRRTAVVMETRYRLGAAGRGYRVRLAGPRRVPVGLVMRTGEVWAYSHLPSERGWSEHAQRRNRCVLAAIAAALWPAPAAEGGADGE
jgi:hypothetical protein